MPAPERAVIVASMAFCAMSFAPPTSADEPPASGSAARPILLDRVVVRWYAPETGGPAKPQFVFQRELAFEARLESLIDPDPEPGPYRDRHVRAALDRRIAETLLASLPITPEPSPKEIALRAEAARAILEQQVHGRDRLIDAASKEGQSSDELDTLLRRKARASLYLDRMVAPLLEPSSAELRDLLRTGTTPFKDQPFEQVSAALGRWYVGQRLGQAVEAYYLSARSRVVIAIVKKPR
ncbi:MAG: hypothetical protein U0359_08120 [Byssovorax sp.]